jgi:sulfate permease, SulP family
MGVIISARVGSSFADRPFIAQPVYRICRRRFFDIRSSLDRRTGITMSIVPTSSRQSVFFQAVRPVTRAAAIKDALAGVQLAALNIPQALGYTKIAGTPIVTGFYTLLLPLLAFTVFGSSRYLVVAADSATAAIFAGGISSMAAVGSTKYVALASTVALLTAGFLLFARLLKLGFLADFLSRTVLVGFLTGVGFQVGIAVLGGMLGVETHSRRSLFQLAEVLRALPHVHLPTVLLSISILVVIFGLHSLAPRIPGPFIAVVCAIVASFTFEFAERGIEIIGPFAGGLPHLGWPDVTWQEIESLLPIAGSCLVMIVAQSAATARVYAVRHHQHLNENSDLLGLSAANFAAGLSGTFVVNGSPTQTAMVESSGGRSQLAQLVTAVVVAFVLLFLTRPIQYLPRCVLGAIVFIIAVRLIDLRGLHNIRRESPGEYYLAVITAAVVVLIGVEQGIVSAMIVSLLRIVGHSYRPHTGVLLRDENRIWKTIPAAQGARTQPGLVIYRFDAALFYANAGLFAEEVARLARPVESPVHWIIIDAEAIVHVDYTASRVLRDLNLELEQQGVELVFARVHPELLADLRRHHIIESFGQQRIFDRLHAALRAFHARYGSPLQDDNHTA